MSTALVAVRENADTAKNSAQKLVEASNSVARNTRELGGNLSDHFAGRRRDSA